MRIMDGLASFPPLVLALAVAGVLGARARERDPRHLDRDDPGLHPARRARRPSRCGRRRSSRRRTRWARSRGRIRRKRVLPNVASPLIVAVSLAIGFALIAEAAAEPARLRRATPDVELGRDDPGRPRCTSASTRGRCSSRALALVLTVLAFNTLGDGLRDALGLGLAQGQAAHQGAPRPHHRHPVRPTTRPPPTRPTALLDGHRPVGRVPHRGGAGDRRRPRELRRRRRARSSALVGESGSGKTVSSLAVMRLVRRRPGASRAVR